MSISDISIRNPVFAWMIMAALMIFGAIGYKNLGVSQLPDVDFPMVSVNLTWEGAAPQIMESDVVDVVEDSVMSIQGIRDVSSSVRQGSASVSIEFDLDRDIDAAVQDVQTKIAQAQRNLPEDIDPPVITKVNPEDQPIMWITFSSDTLSLRDLMAYVQDHLKDQFSTISGVGDIFLGGFQERNLRIWVDAQKLEKYQITVQDVIDAVKEEHVELPAGKLETDLKEYNIRVMGEAQTPEDFASLIIPGRLGRPVYKPIRIGDVAEIEDGLADARRISRTMGKRTVGIGIKKQRGVNEVEVGHRVLARMQELEKTLPEGIFMRLRFNRTQFSEDSMKELAFILVLSALVTSAICWIFLGSFSATLNILLAIPTSILGTFMIMYFMGYTLNTFTVLGLSLAIGIVVDDAIMVLENIVRYRENGFTIIKAASEGSRQITFAALAATIALIAIFMPVAFMKGIMGKFFGQFGITISAAVGLSLLEALTLAPMRCSQFLKVEKRRTLLGRSVEKMFHLCASAYKISLSLVLKQRTLTILLAAAFFAGSLYTVKILRKEFIPPQDQGMFMCRLQAPIGSSLPFTDKRFKEAENFITSRPEVEGYFAVIGGFSGGEVNSGNIFVTLKPREQRQIDPATGRPFSQGSLMQIFRQELKKIPDLKVGIQDLSLSGFSAQRGYPIELSVRGPDWDTLAQSCEKLQNEMAGSGLMVDIDSDYKGGVPEIHVIPNRSEADSRGVNIQSITTTINALLGGTRIAKYSRSGRRYDVRVRLIPSQRAAASDIDRLWVWNNRGELVPLSSVVSITEKIEPSTITRRNRERTITVFANVTPGKSQTDALAAAEDLAKKTLPEGYRAVPTGSSQTFKESFGSLFFAFWLGIAVAYMVLASQFNSFIHPFTVLLALPFSVSGAFIALQLTNQSINIYSLIGIILLMGIVKKNSILLVDFTNEQRRAGLTAKEALIAACPVRLRPILMTSFSTIAAALPPALAIGPGAETRIPMAMTVIGGVAVSTLLTLYVVPCAYSVLSRLERRPASTDI